MREFCLDTVGPAGDCAVLRVTGEWCRQHDLS